MADIGTIVNYLPGQSSYATVRDRYGNEVAVPADQLPKNAEEGQKFAYRVVFSSGGAGTWTVKSTE